MVEVHKEGEVAVFNVRGMHKLWAFKSQLRIPLRAIRSVRQDAGVLKGWWKGVRAPGTHIPGLFIAGSFYQNGKRTFWDVYCAQRAIIVELEHGGAYDQLIVEVADPAAVLALLAAR